MQNVSAGILLYRDPVDRINGEPEIFLIRANHVSNDRELWGVPKGRVEKNEKILDTAFREFQEETGIEAPDLKYNQLHYFKTVYGKIIHIFAALVPNDTEIVWNKENVKYTSGIRNGKLQYYQETRDGQWFPLSTAYLKIGSGQRGLLENFKNYYYGI